ncbi:MAG: polysaccharide biosynthesis C-terminal domain-containing protein [Nevskia sp.]|nr:polysaccharide biosynthesis C-terminal domain-containing protein [Nevskia sp.]
MNISAALRFALGKIDSVDHRHRRLAGIVQGVATGLASRLVGVAVNLLSVPLTIGYLGTERFGIWTLISSMLVWVRLADLGIGNGLNNAIAGALGAERPELARTHISSALAMLSAISLTLGVIIVLAWPWIDWNGLFGVKSALARAEVGPAVAAAFVFFLLGFPLSIIGRTYVAAQDGRLANYWGMAGNLAGLLAIVAVTQTHGGLVWLIIATTGTGFAMSALSGLWLFMRHKPALAPRIGSVRRDSMNGLLHVGLLFFLMQISALVVFETDNLVIAHYLGAAHVPPYSLTYSLFGFTSLIQALLFSYVWIAYSEAIARRDIAWVQRAFILNLAFSLGSTLLAVIPLIFIARPFIRLWAGAAVVPPFDLVLWMAAWSMINAFCSPTACLLAAAAHIRAQTVYSAVAAAINIALSIYLIRRWGITGVIAGTVISYLLFICIPQSIDTFMLIRKLHGAEPSRKRP